MEVGLSNQNCSNINDTKKVEGEVEWVFTADGLVRKQKGHEYKVYARKPLPARNLIASFQTRADLEAKLKLTVYFSTITSLE